MKLLALSLLFLAPQSQLAFADGPEIRFLAERVPGDLGPVCLATEDARSEPFGMPMNNLSAPQTPPARVFNIVSIEEGGTLATVKLPEEGDSFIALLVKLPGKPGYSTVVIPYRNTKFKDGDIYFLNLADKSVLGYVGTTKFILEAGKSEIVTPDGAREAKFYDVGLGVRDEDGDRLLATTRWPESKHTRYYVFFFMDPKTNQITYRGVDEFVPPEQPAP